MLKITSDVVSTSFHSLAFLHHLGMLMWFATLDMDRHTHPIIERIKPFKFLTISGWCLIVQSLHLELSLSVDILRWFKHEKKALKLNKIKDTWFRAIVFPITITVGSAFWILFNINREIVYPEVWDSVIPSFVNHGSHTTIMVFSIIELMLKRTSDIDRKEIYVNLSLGVGYSFLINAVYLMFGVWFYPFLSMMSWWQLLVFEISFCAISMFFMLVTWCVDSRKVKVK